MTTKTDRATYGTEIVSMYVGKRVDNDDPARPWEHHLWEVTLTREGSEPITFEYRMGIAHEQTPCGQRRPQRVGRYEPPVPCQHVRCHNKGYVPTPPDLYDVLTSLKADAPQGATFHEWCGDYGMDEDSIKARELYLACQQSEDRSKRFFGADWATIMDDEEYE